MASSSVSKAQSFNDEKWKELTEDLDYQWPEQEELEKSDNEYVNSNLRNLADSTASQRMKDSLAEYIKEHEFESREPDEKEEKFSATQRIIAYVLIVGLLMAMVLFFVDKDFLKFKNQLKDKTVYERSNPEKLDRKEIKNELDSLLAARNYNEAIRYKYLLLLELYQQKGWITWHKHKTNSEYIKDLSQKINAKDAIKLTRIYEFYWYGETVLSHERFLKISSYFDVAENQAKGGRDE